MEIKLDFSILDGIQSAEGDNALTAERKIYYKLETEEKQKVAIAEAAEKQLEVYAAHQDAIRRAGSLTSDIIKGIQAGKDPLHLLLMAVKCISLMTGDNAVIYEQAKCDIKKVYGVDVFADTLGMEAINGEELEVFLDNQINKSLEKS